MRIKLDENLPQDLTRLLQSAGHEVADVAEEGLSGADDPPVLQAATREERLLMTFDTDFADIRVYPPDSHGGIVVFRLRDQRWLSPIVASELLRGVSGRGRRRIEKLVSRLLPLDPPSWRRCWYGTGGLLPKIFPDHDAIGLARLQNDCLLAFTARYTGALFVAADRHFEAIRRHVPFHLRTLR